ncbi:MAG: hypothetical protein GY953_24345, partial [bacterium]|nr:hypothetical protein [bacterium]
MSTRTDGITSCQQVDDCLDGQFSGDAGALPEPVRDHIQSCPRCAQLYQWIVEASLDEEVRDDFAASIAAQLEKDLEPVKPLPSTRVLVLRFLAVFAVLGGLFASWTGLAGVERMSLPHGVMVGAILAAGAVLLAVSL